eukprot:14750590-Ditylum_brightwellii.AAC.1
MEYRFQEWHEIQKKKEKKIPFYELGDGKCLYMMIGHYQWNVTHHLFIGYKYRRGGGVNEGYSCKTWSDEEYMEAVKKVEVGQLISLGLITETLGLATL